MNINNNQLVPLFFQNYPELASIIFSNLGCRDLSRLSLVSKICKEIAEEQMRKNSLGILEELPFELIDHTLSFLSVDDLKNVDLTSAFMKTFGKPHLISKLIIKVSPDSKKIRKIFRYLCSKKEFDKALEFSNSISSKLTKDHALGEIVSGLISIQQFERALEVTNSITAGSWKNKGRKEIVKGLISVQQFKRALEVANSITESIWKNLASIEIVIGFISIQEFDKALEVARLIPHQSLRELAIEKIECERPKTFCILS